MNEKEKEKKGIEKEKKIVWKTAAIAGIGVLGLILSLSFIPNIVIGLILGIAVLFLALIKFTTIEEGTAIAITSFGGFQRIIFQWEDHWMDENWNIWKKGEEGGKEKKMWGHIFGGLFVYGIRGIHEVHKYNSRWTDIHTTKEGKTEFRSNEEVLDHVLLKPAVYALQLSKIETAPPERIPIDVLALNTMRIGNPYKFLFIAPPTPIEDVLARISALMREVITAKKIDEILELKGEKLWTEEKENVLKGAKLIEDTLKKWGLELADRGIEIKDIDFPIEYQNAIALQSKMRFEAEAKKAQFEVEAQARAAETTGTIIEMMAKARGKKLEEIQKEINDDPKLKEEFLTKAHDLVVRKMGMESSSYVDIRVEGAEGIERTILNALAVWQRIPSGKKEKKEEKPKKPKKLSEMTDEEFEKQWKGFEEKGKKIKGR